MSGDFAEDLIPQSKATRKHKVIEPGTPLEHYHLTPNGNGDRFASRNLGEVMLFSTEKQKTFFSVGADNRWIRNEGREAGDIERRCRAVLDEMRDRAQELQIEAKSLEDGGDDEKAGLLKEVAKNLRSWASSSDNYNAMRTMAMTGCLTYGMVTSPDDDFDTRSDLLATPSQMLELHEDGVITARDIMRSDYVTYSTSVDYDPDILNHEPELITQFRETFVPEKDRWRLIMKALGASLFGGNRHTLLIILEGKSGMNGKSQLMEAVRAVLKDYGVVGNPSIFRGNLDEKARPDILKTLKKRIVFFSEASSNWQLHADRVKNFTGGDGLTLRRMFSDAYMDVVPQCTPVIYTNEIPMINGADNALKRRVLAIEFNRQPKAKDATIKGKFLASEDVKKYLFASLLQGYIESCQAGIEDVLDEFAMYSKGAFEEMSHIGEFFEWLTNTNRLQVLGPDDIAQAGHGVKSKYVTLGEFNLEYSYWVKELGNKQLHNDMLKPRELNKILRETYGWEQVKSGQERWVGRILNPQTSKMFSS